MCEDWGDDDENWSTDRFAGKYKYKYRRTITIIICKLHSKSACAQMATTWVTSQMEGTPPHMLTVCMEVIMTLTLLNGMSFLPLLHSRNHQFPESV